MSGEKVGAAYMPPQPVPIARTAEIMIVALTAQRKFTKVL
jgi:hypothetical protein